MAQSATDDAAHAALSTLDLSAFDLDGDGEIDWKEFVSGCLLDHDVYNDDNLEKVLSSRECTVTLVHCSPSSVKLRTKRAVRWLHNVQVFRELDKDGSGTLSLAEISSMLGDDACLKREILVKLQAQRKDQPLSSLEEMVMTLQVGMVSHSTLTDRDFCTCALRTLGSSLSPLMLGCVT